ncbi:hypothetical protein [Maribellus sp. YY47]|uniref:hypothetical protein n=1 Tax=Maribellus sp. YY47 TaxID=2929486 RepID=UPI002001D631|nr:hypothetical protein [Maribellus sp. YY47]MCK3683003.1 hypothetical protein [Maribellus sp. YY47]
MTWFTLLIFFSYLILIIAIIPKSAFEFDLLQIKFNLLPYWSKLISLTIIISAIIAFVSNRTADKALEYLVATINLALFIFLFSRQKTEDEFTEQIRFKSFTYSFVSFVGMIGAFSSLGLASKDDNFFLNNFLLSILIGTSMLMALIYFNITVYKSRKV